MFFFFLALYIFSFLVLCLFRVMLFCPFVCTVDVFNCDFMGV